ncbi:family 1 glycosylhydrolase [uncultured Ferrimonas sp.]|uniref:family 1 glycosylhydrolase n=1 Tax=uncultured Ferrimonas sp. TaxID=432640 RepID=UPI00262AD816|nr:family 1 glycosylhydrolase [uncultured Ferrimonas sp.]
MSDPLPLFEFSKFAGIHDPRFHIGTATAAFQIEGSGHTQGRAASIWDQFHGAGHSIAGDGCAHLQHWRDDLKLVKELGFDSYRLSLSWPRLINDHDGHVAAAGVAFYRQLLQQLQQLELRAVVTLYHWDLPEYWQQQGGWCNRQTAIAFAQYAKMVAETFGDLIDTIYTINEPWVVAMLGHRSGEHAPGIQDEQAAFHCAHHLLLAHGLAVNEIRAHCSAKVGIVLNGGPCDPVTISSNDQRAAQYAYQEGTELFASPLFNGNYPELVLARHQQHLPAGWQQDLLQIQQPLDRLGLNYYCRYRISEQHGEQPGCAPLSTMGWEQSALGLYRWLTKLQRQHPLPPIEITENGIALEETLTEAGLRDPQRWHYICEHLKAVDAAICDGIDLRGYFVWTLMDNFEWGHGYSQTFGIVHVDRNTMARTPKASALALQASLKQRQQNSD